MIYFDPPYYEKGKKLYMNYFEKKDHIEIEEIIRTNVKCDWVITYDDDKEILKIYDKYVIKRFDLKYSVADKRTASELIIFPKNEICPTDRELEQYSIDINFR